jgi:hypothetical protein
MAAQSGDPFERNAVGIELGLGVLAEAWNFNQSSDTWLSQGEACPGA